MDSWNLQKQVARRLLVLNAANIVVGVALRLSRDKLTQGVAEQNIAWGAINCALAVVGEAGSDHQKAQLANPYDADLMQTNYGNLKRLLWINTGLDVLYMLGGIALAARSTDHPKRKGTGIGIVLQGGLLFIFDIFHALE